MKWRHVSHRGPALSPWQQPELLLLSSRIPRWSPHVAPAAQVDGNYRFSSPILSSTSFAVTKKKGLISRKVSYRYVAAFVFSLSVLKNALFYAVEKVFRLEKMFRSTWEGGKKKKSRIPNFPCQEIGLKKQKFLFHHRRRNNDCEASPIWIPGHPLHTYTDTERLGDNFLFVCFYVVSSLRLCSVLTLQKHRSSVFKPRWSSLLRLPGTASVSLKFSSFIRKETRCHVTLPLK